MKIKDLREKWPIAYEHCLRTYNVKYAAAIAKHYSPTKIYKYYSFSDPFWEKNLFDYEIAFNFPSNFNDPMDSRWFLDYEKIYKERFKDIGEEWNFDIIGGKERFLDTIQLNEEDLMYLRDMFYLSCFSTNPYSALMWGHYAEKHKGFCIEYDVKSLPENMRVLLPVIYAEKPFDASMILDMRGIEDNLAMLCPYLFKSVDWKYEKEWRIFIKNKGEGQQPLILNAPNAISGVYMGLKSYLYDKQYESVEEWCVKNNVRLNQMERSYLSFDLVSDEISSIRSNKKTKGLLL